MESAGLPALAAFARARADAPESAGMLRDMQASPPQSHVRVALSEWLYPSRLSESAGMLRDMQRAPSHI